MLYKFSGLSLVLDIGKEDYIPVIGEAAGVVVVVTNPNEMAFPEDEGVFALPGKNTAIGLRYVWIFVFNMFFTSTIYIFTWKKHDNWFEITIFPIFNVELNILLLEMNTSIEVHIRLAMSENEYRGRQFFPIK